MHDTNHPSKIEKAGMPFKIFQKRDTPSSPASLSSRLVPATPKMRIGEFSLKPPVTPTLTDASLRGEQKRTGILEAQLKEVSLTASKAYDQVEDLTLRNNMLEDQVLQQKQLIESFTQQLEDAARVRQELKSFQELEREKIEIRGQELDTFSKLAQEKEALRADLERMKEELQRCKSIIGEKNVVLENMSEQHRREVQQLSKQLRSVPTKPQVILRAATPTGDGADKCSQYRDIVDMQKKKIEELEAELEVKTDEYEKSLGEIKNTMLVLKNSQMFLSKQGYSSPSIRGAYFGNVGDGDGGAGGDTYVLSNISFLP